MGSASTTSRSVSSLEAAGRERRYINHHGERYLVEARVCAAEPDVGIMLDWSEDHALYDPETEERLSAVEAALTDSAWEEVAELFDGEPSCEAHTS